MQQNKAIESYSEEEQKQTSQALQIQGFDQIDMLISSIYGNKNDQNCNQDQQDEEMEEDDFLFQPLTLPDDKQTQTKETMFLLQLEIRNLKQELEAEKKKNLKLLDIAKKYLDNFQLLQEDYIKQEEQKRNLEQQIYELSKSEIEKQLRMQRLSEPRKDYSIIVKNTIQKQTNQLNEMKINQKQRIIRKTKNPQTTIKNNFENKGKELQKEIQSSHLKQATQKCEMQNTQQEQQVKQNAKRLTKNKIQQIIGFRQ